MFLPLIYYSIGILMFMLLYAYHRNNANKQVENLDFLKNLESIPWKQISISHKRSFEQIKKEMIFYCYFQQVRITFGIDLSASNQWHGRRCFQGQSLHQIQTNKIYNPYQKVISQLGNVFEQIFTSKLQYSGFYFGDNTTKDYTYLPLIGPGDKFSTYQHVLAAYLEKIKDTVFGGPTSFIPILKQLLVYGVYSPNIFTTLIILTDELKVSHQDPSHVQIFRLLANLPNVCLIIVGVGDGPWQKMSYEEHRLRELIFQKIDSKKIKEMEMYINPSKVSYDNFHFVNFNAYPMKMEKGDTENYFVRAVLRKLPTQLKQAFRNCKQKTKENE